MARAAIFVTLIAATLVGPCLCCCVFGRHFATATADAGKDSQTPTVGACPHCRVAKAAPTSTELAPTTPNEPKHDCPCCEVRSSLPAIAPPLAIPFVVDTACVGIVCLTSDALSPGAECSARGEYPPGLGTKAFLLDSCHRLRC